MTCAFPAGVSSRPRLKSAVTFGRGRAARNTQTPSVAPAPHCRRTSVRARVQVWGPPTSGTWPGRTLESPKGPTPHIYSFFPLSLQISCQTLPLRQLCRGREKSLLLYTTLPLATHLSSHQYSRSWLPSPSGELSKLLEVPAVLEFWNNKRPTFAESLSGSAAPGTFRHLLPRDQAAAG
ncbi:uncharacterized protein LOC123638666 [Lemur catta]|uniref:uncharacterized protein LOC123638666 n=1 Tax=Lemur catta TaxID=9447 RepID=UPI001E26855A|nr:uncharacterized protein LOC123638666 [Lemur catta]